MACGILKYYFPTTNNYTVVSRQSRNNTYADFIVLRLEHLLSGDRSVIDHTLVQVKPTSDPISLEQLENALEHANTNFRRCWAIIIHEFTFTFYEYHRDLPKHTRLVPWGPPNQHQQSSFHARKDIIAID